LGVVPLRAFFLPTALFSDAAGFAFAFPAALFFGFDPLRAVSFDRGSGSSAARDRMVMTPPCDPRIGARGPCPKYLRSDGTRRSSSS